MVQMQWWLVKHGGYRRDPELTVVAQFRWQLGGSMRNGEAGWCASPPLWLALSDSKAWRFCSRWFPARKRWCVVVRGADLADGGAVVRWLPARVGVEGGSNSGAAQMRLSCSRWFRARKRWCVVVRGADLADGGAVVRWLPARVGVEGGSNSGAAQMRLCVVRTAGGAGGSQWSENLLPARVAAAMVMEGEEKIRLGFHVRDVRDGRDDDVV
ncbi:hypothetical protein DEO72_LG10g497 [Vigna unguiculata]|uniref:Uncharacterized protein n=1 Tax=Vigna unguiculata TaxID=3917 RepID=A0A4D6N7M8_VIGUN|nr:hypothetical protein DEO72_LG10g497 [Vigna unguiculata]